MEITDILSLLTTLFGIIEDKTSSSDDETVRKFDDKLKKALKFKVKDDELYYNNARKQIADIIDLVIKIIDEPSSINTIETPNYITQEELRAFYDNVKKDKDLWHELQLRWNWYINKDINAIVKATDKKIDAMRTDIEMIKEEMLQTKKADLPFPLDSRSIIPYLTFQAASVQILCMTKEVPTLEYSFRESEWKELGTEKVEFGGEKGMLLLRGKSRIGTNGATIMFSTEAKVVCTGDIRTLVDYCDCTKTDTSKATFKRLFWMCKQLIVAPELPAMNLANGCYYQMFAGCTLLEKAPNLPAEYLSVRCYSNMFFGCKSLKHAPVISAKYMAEGSCQDMFYRCSSLKEAPELLAESLAKECYCNMFHGCVSLEKAPDLPAKLLAEGCYGAMFSCCTSLKESPQLPAKFLSVLCYCGMFSGCTSLIEPPELQAENLVEGCYWKMFHDCVSLKKITMMATEIKANACLDYWKDGVSSSGTFYKSKYAKWNNEGVVPDGWTVKLIDPETEEE